MLKKKQQVKKRYKNKKISVISSIPYEGFSSFFSLAYF